MVGFDPWWGKDVLSVCVEINCLLLALQVSALVTMYSHEEDIDGAIDVFKQAIEHYQSEQVCSGG